MVIRALVHEIEGTACRYRRCGRPSGFFDVQSELSSCNIVLYRSPINHTHQQTAKGKQNVHFYYYPADTYLQGTQYHWNRTRVQYPGTRVPAHRVSQIPPHCCNGPVGGGRVVIAIPRSAAGRDPSTRHDVGAESLRGGERPAQRATFQHDLQWRRCNHPGHPAGR